MRNIRIKKKKKYQLNIKEKKNKRNFVVFQELAFESNFHLSLLVAPSIKKKKYSLYGIYINFIFCTTCSYCCHFQLVVGYNNNNKNKKSVLMDIYI